jgi:hypothetical protein
VLWQVFIDSDGRVAFYRRGDDVDSLRAAIAAIGPQYSKIVVPTAETAALTLITSCRFADRHFGVMFPLRSLLAPVVDLSRKVAVT